MNKILPLFIFVTVTALAFVLVPTIRATTILSDTFHAGYNTTLWSIYPGQFAPISTSFGISVDPAHSTQYSSLVYSGSLESDLIFKIDTKINTSIPADLGIFVESTSTGQWKNAYLFGVGTGGTPNTAILRDSAIWGDPSTYLSGSWDTSINTHHIELHISGNNSNPIILKEDGNTLLSWLSNLNFAIDKITLSMFGTGSEFANLEVCDTNGCGTATPSPTLVPTPTNTPTPTPTPTPSGPKKVIVVPGIGASWNFDAFVNCKADGYSGTWSKWVIANADFVQPLITGINNAGYQAIPFWYDWRKQVTDTAPQLNAFIQANRLPNETVDVVGHSLGGLVSRAYLQSTQTNSHTDKLLTVGSPHQGAVFAYPAWSGGEMWLNSTLLRLAFTSMNKLCSVSKHMSGRAMVNTYFPSVQNLLPTFDYLKDIKTGTLKPVGGMYAQNNWLPNTFTPNFYGVTVGAIYGKGLRTLKQLEVTKPNRADQLAGNWWDGKPTDHSIYASGDGTVTADSSQIPGALNIPVALEHTDLIMKPDGIRAITDFLSGVTALATPQALSLQTQQQMTYPSSPASALMIIIDGATATLSDKHGHTYQDSNGQITILNPSDEEYELTVRPAWPHKYHVYVMQLFEDGSSTWKEYDRSDFLKKHFKLRFDRKGKHEDVLEDD